MRERNRRLLCRWLFLLLGLAPTFGVSGYVIANRLPSMRALEREKWEAAVRHELGTSVVIGHVSRPTMGVTAWNHVRLLDNETDIVLAHVETIEIFESPDCIEIAATQIELPAGQLRTLVHEIHQRLLCGKRTQSRPVRFQANGVLVRTGAESFTLPQLIVDIPARSNSPEISVQFRVAGPGTPQCILVARRNRDLQPPATELSFESGPAGLPTTMLVDLFPSLGCLGNECRFQGRIAATTSESGPTGEVEGRLFGINGDDLVTAWLPHKLSGRAEVALQSVRFRDGRLTDAVGDMDMQDGVISQSLLMSAAEFLPIQLPDSISKSDQALWKYEHLALHFEIGDDGLSLRGTCNKDGDLIVSADQPLATSRKISQTSVLALVRALAPSNEIHVPASRQTAGLVHILPIPDIVMPTRSAQWHPRYAPVRMKR